jgi:hypothetical protein
MSGDGNEREGLLAYTSPLWPRQRLTVEDFFSHQRRDYGQCRCVDPTLPSQQAKKLFDELLESEDRAVLLLLTQLLARLAEATSGRVESSSGDGA